MADRNRAQRIATVSGRRDNPQQFETDRNRRQQQGGSQAAKNPVVEHKEASNRALDILELRSLWFNRFRRGTTCGLAFDGCSTPAKLQKFSRPASRSGSAIPLVYEGMN